VCVGWGGEEQCAAKVVRALGKFAVHSAALPEKQGMTVICVELGCEQSVNCVSVPGASGLPGVQRVEMNCVVDGVEQSVSTVCAVVVPALALPHPELTYCGGLSHAPVAASCGPSHAVHCSASNKISLRKRLS
jgi:hypothetical protein